MNQIQSVRITNGFYDTVFERLVKFSVDAENAAPHAAALEMIALMGFSSINADRKREYKELPSYLFRAGKLLSTGPQRVETDLESPLFLWDLQETDQFKGAPSAPIHANDHTLLLKPLTSLADQVRRWIGLGPEPQHGDTAIFSQVDEETHRFIVYVLASSYGWDPIPSEIEYLRQVAPSHPCIIHIASPETLVNPSYDPELHAIATSDEDPLC